jgi:hypothetical protein
MLAVVRPESKPAIWLHDSATPIGHSDTPLHRHSKSKVPLTVRKPQPGNAFALTLTPGHSVVPAHSVIPVAESVVQPEPWAVVGVAAAETAASVSPVSVCTFTHPGSRARRASAHDATNVSERER